MADSRIPEKLPDHFEDSDDFEAYSRSLDSVMKRSNELLGISKERELTDKEKAELPRVVTRLRQLLKIQMNWNGRIAKIDMEDGSYDNATIDNKLRVQLRALRNLDIDVHRMWGTQTIRKISSAITEDIPNWFGIKWQQLKDNAKQFLKIAGVAAGATAGAYALGGWLMGHGPIAGLKTLGDHVGWLASGIGGAFSSLKKRMFG